MQYDDDDEVECSLEKLDRQVQGVTAPFKKEA